jgi:hypothetical protein
VRELNPDVPEWLVEIIDRLLRKYPDDRFQTARKVSEVLSQHIACLQDKASLQTEDRLQTSWSAPGGKTPSRTTRRPPWQVVLGVLLILAMGLGMIEATGVTDLAATVIRLATGEGTLVVKVDDPGLRITIDGEGIRIRGTGIEELKLRPGLHRIAASKNGRPIPLEQELITITRGGKQVVTVSREPGSRPAASSNDTAKETATEPAHLPPGSSAHILTSDDYQWTEPEDLGFIAKGMADQGYPHLTDQGRTLLIGSRAKPDWADDIWMATQDPATGHWSDAVKLGPPINSPAMDSGPFLTENGLTLYFHSARDGGQGDADLWYSTRKSRAQPWSQPINLGPVVNHPDPDQSPCLSADELTLVFESTRPGGLGSFDLYACRRKSRDDAWSAPENLGPQINSTAWEGCPELSRDGLSLVFHTGRGGLRVATRPSPDAPWSSARRLDPTGNDEFCCHPTLSEDARTLLFVLRRPFNGQPHLWISHRVPKASH